MLTLLIFYAVTGAIVSILTGWTVLEFCGWYMRLKGNRHDRQTDDYAGDETL